MRKMWLVAVPAVCAAVSGLGTRAVSAAEAVGLPTYSRQQQVEACLSTYGMENSSVLDCVARDEKEKSTLAAQWSNLADQAKTRCVTRLGAQHMGSYFFLDRCIKSAENSAAKPE